MSFSCTSQQKRSRDSFRETVKWLCRREKVSSVKEQILAVQRMQDYMEAHLDEKLGLSELSEVSLFSPWYSYRIFREYTGLTPSGYIRRLRLAKAALRIKNKHIHMIDAAFDLGFDSGGRLLVWSTLSISRRSERIYSPETGLFPCSSRAYPLTQTGIPWDLRYFARR